MQPLTQYKTSSPTPKNWFCASCGDLVSIIGSDLIPVMHEPSIRLVIEKKPHRLCMKCVDSAIRQDKQIRDMRSFLRVNFPNKTQDRYYVHGLEMSVFKYAT